MSNNNIHVTRRKDTWAVIREGAEKAAGLYNTQTAAINVARPMAKNNKSELVIHDRQNKIRDKDSYGDDACPPKDKKL